MPRKIPDVIAAVDLGSNSFHMVVARYSHGQLIIQDRLRAMVRLAAGLDEGSSVLAPGLMTGTAGIGHALLRLAAPDDVPSVLTLAPPVSRAARGPG